MFLDDPEFPTVKRAGNAMPEKTSQIDSLLDEARACVKRREMSKAIDLYEQALAQDSRYLPALEGLAGVLFLVKEYDRAIELFQKITRIDPRRPDALINIGAIQNRQGKYAEAVKTLRGALAKDRRSATAYYNLGIAHRGANQLSMSVSAYKEAIRLDPEMAEAYSNLGNVLVEMGNHTQAVLNFRRALEIRPNFEKAKQGLLKAQDRADDAKKAISPFGRLVDVDSLNRQQAKMEAKFRELTPQERFDDRSTVHKLAKEAEQRAADLLNQLRDEMASLLLDLARLMTENKDKQIWAREVEHLQSSRDRFESLRQSLAATMNQLKSHEDEMRRPE